MKAWFKGGSWYDFNVLHTPGYKYKEVVTYERYELGLEYVLEVCYVFI